jgi:LysM repeat protein
MPTIPPVTTIPATVAPISQTTPVASQKFAPSAKVAVSNWKDRAPVSSPDLKATPALKIAQSELPGNSTPPPAPIPSDPSIRDTGSGYPTNIPRNYFGPALATGTGNTSFGAISRFKFAENYSLRPSAVFGGGGSIIRVPLTYDFVFGDREPFERNPVITFNAGGGVQFTSLNGGSSQFSVLGTIGVDVNLFEGTALVASYNTDFSNVNGVTFGLGFEF